MIKDLKTIASIYTITILSVWLLLNNVQTKKEIAKHKTEILEVKKVATQLDERLARFEDMVLSLNNELDIKQDEIQEYYYLESLKKDLR
jgi:cell division septum initiation protein DivIVA